LEMKNEEEENKTTEGEKLVRCSRPFQDRCW